MNVNYEKLMKCFECVQQKITFKPEIALILGSGLGDYADTMEVVETLDYHDIEGFPVSTVPGHKGRFVFGYAGRRSYRCNAGQSAISTRATSRRT